MLLMLPAASSIIGSEPSHVQRSSTTNLYLKDSRPLRRRVLSAIQWCPFRGHALILHFIQLLNSPATYTLSDFNAPQFHFKIIRSARGVFSERIQNPRHIRCSSIAQTVRISLNNETSLISFNRTLAVYENLIVYRQTGHTLDFQAAWILVAASCICRRSSPLLRSFIPFLPPVEKNLTSISLCSCKRLLIYWSREDSFFSSGYK
jgi:hypothetical protein